MANYKGKNIHVEVKSLNSKSLDLNVRLASLYREKEMEIRQLVADKLVRGKVDLSIWIEKNEKELAAPVNATVVYDYFCQISRIAQEMGLDMTNINAAEWMAVILRLPDTITSVEVEVLSDDEWCDVEKAIRYALDELINFRIQEGVALQSKFNEKVDNIELFLHEIEPFEKMRIQKIRQRITENLESISNIDYDKNRLEQEMIYYIEKLDINEEKQRLKNHLDYFRKTMEDEPGQGKKLGFIAQEMGREINTTGSKSNLAQMQNIVVKMKDELEQIKEQVLNVL